MAALDFEPWHDAAAEKMPTLEEIEDPHLIYCRVAFALVHKPKPELVQMFVDDVQQLFCR